MLHWMSRCSLELIAQAGVGSSFDDLQEGQPANEYMMASKQLMSVLPNHGFHIVVGSLTARNRPLSFPLQAFMRAIPYMVKVGSPTLLKALVGIAPHASIRKIQHIAYFLHDTNAELYWQRRQAIITRDETVAHRDDSLSFLSMFLAIAFLEPTLT